MKKLSKTALVLMVFATSVVSSSAMASEMRFKMTIQHAKNVSVVRQPGCGSRMNILGYKPCYGILLEGVSGTDQFGNSQKVDEVFFPSVGDNLEFTRNNAETLSALIKHNKKSAPTIDDLAYTDPVVSLSRFTKNPQDQRKISLGKTCAIAARFFDPKHKSDGDWSVTSFTCIGYGPADDIE